ncbi:gastric intrinsic factor-like isoform X2 [Acanthaster planci]|uniref:Gastric intrinsic factor-like isoform X2 n=1 Tax=Acanthaster planci TaxID=133434 RepID=A0A8B8A3Q2_ACAPL|nr:gastric intrinsic factor-like isoform X2 [Acanthaster planci]
MEGLLAPCFIWLALLSGFNADLGEGANDLGEVNAGEEHNPVAGLDDEVSPPPTSCVDDDVTCALIGATRWLLQQQEVDWDWNGGISTSSVVMAMQLANESWYREKALETQLAIKQLEIELLAELSRSAKLSGCGTGSQRHSRLAKISVGRLALYMLALEATCHNTEDFYGNDLVEVLEHNMRRFPRKDFNNHFQYSLGVLALCQSGQGAVKLKHIRELLNGQREDGCYRFDGRGADVASMSVMALSCARGSVPTSFKSRFEQKFNKTMSCILSKQQDDASFGNGISTALASQALKAASVPPSVWRAEEALQRVLETQHEDGHFGNLGATVQILPLLANRHHGSVKDIKMACLTQADSAGSQPGSEPTDPTEQPGPPITIQIVLENSIDTNQQPVTVSVTAPAGSKLFKFLQVAMEESQGTFRFESKMTDFGNFVTSFNGVANDDVNHRYWSILIGPNREYATTGPDGIIPEDGVDYIFRYKSY